MRLGDEMPKDPLETLPPSDGGLSRRRFMQGAAALAAAAALPSLPGVAGASTAIDQADERDREAQAAASKRPNIVLLITDQERFPQHWPDGWADRNLPNRRRFAQHALTFTRAFCSSSMCSPSRATLFTGLYPAQHGVTQVLQTGMDAVDQPTLQPTTQNMARMLASAGYDVQYRGKWHMSKDPSGTLDVQSQRDLERYGFRGWLPPDGGQDQDPEHFGGGDTDYDAQYVAQAAAFLKAASPKASKPFALVISLVNPHDIMAHPKTWDSPSFSDIAPFKGTDNYGEDTPGCLEQGIDLPSTVDEHTERNFKPAAQARSTVFWATGLGPLATPREQLDYVNFYAFLHRESDRHIGTVLDALDANPAVRDKTIVIRTADHGEMGLAHGGMRQKAYNAYEETLHIPLAISNPKMFPRPVRTGALASLVDLMPTIATLGQVPDRGKWTFKGKDLGPIISDAVAHPTKPTASVQESVLFTTDEVIGSTVVGQPSHIRCIRQAEWKFAMWFDPSGGERPEYELYDLSTDPDELHNMADPAGPYHDLRKAAEMRALLVSRMAETGTTPT